MDGTAHRRAECAIHEPMLFDQRFAAEGAGHDARLIVVASAGQVPELEIHVAEARPEQAFDFGRLNPIGRL